MSKENPADPSPSLSPSDTHASPLEPPTEQSLQLLKDVEVEVTLEIGRRRVRIAELLRLRAGQMLELTKAAGEPLDIYVNGQRLGRGEAVVIGDRYGVRITELSSEEEGKKS